MKKTFKFYLFILLLIACLVSFAGCKYTAKTSDKNANVFSKSEAIAELVKNHSEFSVNPNDTVTMELPTGGPSGSTANVKFTTKVEPSGKDAYVVTLTKDWGITVNGVYVKSFWKYKVTKDSIKLLESVDNDSLPNTMK